MKIDFNNVYIILCTIVTVTSVFISFAKNFNELKKIFSDISNFLFYRKRQEKKMDKLILDIEKNTQICNNMTDRTNKIENETKIMRKRIEEKVEMINKRLDDVEVLSLKHIIWNPHASLEERVAAGERYVNTFHKNSTTKALYLNLKDELMKREEQTMHEQFNIIEHNKRRGGKKQ